MYSLSSFSFLRLAFSFFLSFLPLSFLPFSRFSLFFFLFFFASSVDEVADVLEVVVPCEAGGSSGSASDSGAASFELRARLESTVVVFLFSSVLLRFVP